MNDLKIFENSEFGSVRVVTGPDGEPWFVAKDICEALELGNMHSSLALLDEDERGIHSMDTLGGPQEMATVSEPGLYSLILRSRKPEAKAFKRWVTHDVLPAIRRTGGYLTPAKIEEALLNPDTIIQLATDLKAEREKRLALEAQAEQDRPLVGFAKAVQSSEDTILVKHLAGFMKQNGVDIGQNRLFEWLRENGFLCRERGGNRNKPTQKSMNLGLFEVKESIGLHSDGTTRIFLTSKVTGKGQHYFLKKFGVTDAEAKV